uniref:KAP family P-loop NTPase fold protein n=1 Tax=Clostridium sp. 12(A) TaxID=1163671 RepID=UPI0004636667|nr:P-loop NTPase fold protein [Clostridium sp. 12(A)]
MDTTDDILNRQVFLENLKKIVEMLSNERKSSTFAINGEWGSGKSFVLKRFIEDIENIQSEDTVSEKYLVFYYDCWKYDYYEEPLIAIIAAMFEMAEEKLKFLSTTYDKTMKATWNTVKNSLETIAGEFCKSKIGFDPYKFIGDVKKEYKEVTNSRHEFDNMFSFKLTLDTIKKQLQRLANNHTIIIIVDEIDRCLPVYAIKILERLHHTFFDIKNVIVIIAVDGDQLDNTIKQIYGQNTNVNRYLKKFIDFKLNLDIGKTNLNYAEKYLSYFSKFYVNSELYEVMEVLASLLDNIDMRTQEKLFNKADTIHRIVSSEKNDISLLFFEMMWIILTYKQDSQNLRWVVSGDNSFKITRSENDMEIKIKEIADQYCGPSCARIDGKDYLIVKNSAVGKSFFYLSSIYNNLENGTCGIHFFDNANELMDEILKAQNFVSLTYLIQ